MPPASKNINAQIRALAYGRPKTKKSWWAYRAAEAGFNVHCFDFDSGGQIAHLIDPQYRDRINIIDVTDKPGKAVGAEFTAFLLRGSQFLYDETLKEIRIASPKADSGHYLLNINKVKSNDLFVMDSWTAFTMSVRLNYAIENKVDLSDAKKHEWDYYRAEGDYCNWVLDQIKNFRCQWIVIAHLTIYEKYRNRVENGRKVRDLVEEREIIKSVSNPHALTVPGSFTDVLRFFKTKTGNFQISTKPSAENDAGSRHVAPNIYDWDKLQFKELAKAAGVLPNEWEPSEAVRYFGPGETVEGFNLVTNKPLIPNGGTVNVELNKKPTNNPFA